MLTISYDFLSNYSRGSAARKILQGDGVRSKNGTVLLINPARHGQNWFWILKEGYDKGFLQVRA